MRGVSRQWLWVGVFAVGLLSSAPATAQVCSAPPAGLVAWWQAEGNAADSVGANDGILMNGASFAPGLVGQAFDLDGTDDHVAVGDPDDLRDFPGGITLEAWIFPRTAALPVSNQAVSNIISKWGNVVNRDAYILALIGVSPSEIRTIGGIGVPGSGESGVRGGIAVPINSWSHIALTYDVATGVESVYLNGLLDGTKLRPGGIQANTSAKVMLGREDSGHLRHFDGLIDEASIWNRPLTENELWDIFVAGPSGKCASIEDIAAGAEAAIADLVDTGVLTGGQGNALSGKLEDALDKFNAGKTKPALNKLNAFINQVTALIAGGTLTHPQGDPLIAAAQAIIDQIENG